MILGAAILLAAQLRVGEPLRVSIEGVDGCNGSLRVRELATETADSAVVPVTAGFALVERNAGNTVELTLTSPECWAAPVTVRPSDAAATLKAFPAARIAGRLAIRGRDALPALLSADIRRIEDTALAETARNPCRLAGPSFECVVPSAPVTVRLAAQGFAPHYLSGLEVPAGKKRDVGTLFLTRGASVSGWVVMEDKAAPQNVKLTLTPTYATATEPDIPTMTRLTDADGFFQFAAVPLGSYELVATKRGWSPASSERVTVTGATESVLRRPLVLHTLATLQVVVQSVVANAGEAWRIRIQRHGRFRGELLPVSDEPLPPSGVYQRAGLERDSYQISVLDPHGSVAARGKVDVTGEFVVHTLRITAIPIVGTITLGAEPLAAKLTFSWRDGSRVRMEAGIDGVFRGVLSHAGLWQVGITPSNYEAVEIRSRTVSIEQPDGGASAEVNIELPAGRLDGLVRDENGRPATAQVFLRRNRSIEATTRSDSTGTFEFIGIEPGSVTINAVAEGAESGVVPTSAAEERGEPLTLTLRAHRRIRGRTVSQRGDPIAGTLIRYTTPTTFETREVLSGPDGEFEMDVPGGSPVVTFAALSPGLPTKLKTIAIDPGTNLEIPLGGPSATLIIALSGMPYWPLVTSDRNGFLGLRFLNPPPGGALPFDNAGPEGFEYVLETGTYTICPEARSSERCESRTLAPGAHVLVDGRGLWNAAKEETQP